MDPGARLGGGRYVVKGLLGEGAQGTTYEAADAETGKIVAIKRFDVRGAKSWKDVELAERETRVLATLDHPLVPRYIGHFEEAGALYLVMEKVEGESLEAIRKREGPMPEAEVRRFLASADRALTYLHGRGSPVIHRDLKPSNVIRRPDGSYVFVDFGAVGELLVRRGTNTVVGTMGYMAPEQIQGRALAASDVYAVGATALAALTGVEPETLPYKGLRVDVAGALSGRASPELALSLERMLEPDPELRAPSVAAALDGVPPPRAVALPVARAPRASDEAAARSIRGLLWALWGISWVIVPLIFGKLLGLPELIPVVMFSWLALNLIVGWHRAAVIRAVLRRLRGEEVRAEPSVARQRVEVDALGDSQRHQVRVHATGLDAEEMVAGTELQRKRKERARRL